MGSALVSRGIRRDTNNMGYRVTRRTDIVEGALSLLVLLNVKGKNSWWFTSVYGPTRSRFRSFLWEEQCYLFGLYNVFWCAMEYFNACWFSHENKMTT